MQPQGAGSAAGGAGAVPACSESTERDSGVRNKINFSWGLTLDFGVCSFQGAISVLY